MNLLSESSPRYTIYLLSKKDGKVHRNGSEFEDKARAKLAQMAGWMQFRQSTLVLENPNGEVIAIVKKGKLQ